MWVVSEISYHSIPHVCLDKGKSPRIFTQHQHQHCIAPDPALATLDEPRDGSSIHFASWLLTSRSWAGYWKRNKRLVQIQLSNRSYCGGGCFLFQKLYLESYHICCNSVETMLHLPFSAMANIFSYLRLPVLASSAVAVVGSSLLYFKQK